MTAAKRWTRRVLPWLCVVAAIVWASRTETARDTARISFGLAVLTGLVLLGIVAWCWSLDGDTQRHDDNQRIIDRTLRTHDEQLAGLHRDLTALCDWLGVDVLEPVADDSPGHEEFVESEDRPGWVRVGIYDVPIAPLDLPEQPATEPMPAQKPSPRPRDLPVDTVESHAVVVGGARLPAAQDDAKTYAAEWVEEYLRNMRAAEPKREHRDEDVTHGAA